MNKLFIGAFFTVILGFALASCSKNDYFINPSGTHNGNYDGSVLDYLDSRPDYFDSLSKVVRLAGLDDVLSNDSVTFFAPPDSTINRSLKSLNDYLYNRGQPLVTSLSQISGNTWKSMLSRYIFKGSRKLQDYPQIDIDNLNAFGGQYYLSIDSTFMNIGVVYSDLISYNSDGTVANTIEYAGYRYLELCYIPSSAAPTQGRIYSTVSSSDIHPKNGYVHVLSIQSLGISSSHYFGFNAQDFINSAINEGITY